ncbi:DUF547 domain-containing protein [Aequorivita echinoideorum]|uniref:DUF547 domain-containing protein n=1 Tax=Aequorivita echinoideorum TaxID=1549647 RepID=A0ABS5S2L5_9FLAO|nr:DUF547 domain-containing protein [Aequorivita echinoideorum]MBT0607448.1 DUF547 domain-containing protein [Aequorivita echinoideorum]
MRTFNLLIFLVLIAISAVSCKNDKGLPATEKKGELSSDIQENIVNHSEWDALLKKYVDEKGYVDYPGFQSDSLKLNAYMKNLAENPPQESWPIEEQLAYYINSYNAGTVQLIIRNNMPGSIKDITDDGGPWGTEFIKIGDKTVSLNTIEKGILQPMKEPRIHFAINCASESCPKLLREAYTAKNVDELMTRATNEFLNGPKNQITPNDPKISSIFEFYPADFKVDGKTIIEFINEYSDVKINKDAELNYIPYDWSLNNQQNIPQ